MRVAWISYFPTEWLSNIPGSLKRVPRQHPATWQQVLLAELERNPGVKVHILVLRQHYERSETFERNGVVFHLIKTIGGLRAPSLFWYDTWLIIRALKRIRPDLVHAWGTENGSALIASRLGYPYLVTMQGILSWLATVSRLDRYHRFTARLEDTSLRRAPLVTAESVFAVQYLKNRYPHLDVRQVEHAPFPSFQNVSRRPQKSPMRFLFVGSFSFMKGADVMLRALDQLRKTLPIELVCVGHVDEKLAGTLRSEVSTELWQSIRFTGYLTEKEIGAELSLATVLIYPTRCDNSPNAVKEAIVAGVPVVATRIGGIPDYLFHGENGLLCAAGDVNALTEVLREAVRHPLFSAGAVPAESLARARAYLSPGKMAEKFFETYGYVCGLNPGYE